MNFLAHIHLSFDDIDLTIGNFIADSVKGAGLPHHSERIKTGIALHRAIDDYTDHHPIVRQSKGRLLKKYGHYSAVLVDIFYDHFLALNWSDYRREALADFAQRHYRLFNERHDDLPEPVQYMLPFMVRHDWLTNYADLQGIQSVLNGMSQRASFQSKMEQATSELRKYHREFGEDFAEFFEELTQFVQEKTPGLVALETDHS